VKTGDIHAGRDVYFSLITMPLEKPLAFAIISIATLLTAIAAAQVNAAALFLGSLNGVIEYFSSLALIAGDPERFWAKILRLDESAAKSEAASGATFYLLSYIANGIVLMRMQKLSRDEIVKYFLVGSFTSVVLICASGICSQLAGLSFPVASVIACNFYSAGAFLDGFFLTYFIALSVLALIDPSVFTSLARSKFRKFPDGTSGLGYRLSLLVLFAGIFYTAKVAVVAVLMQSNSYIISFAILSFAIWGLRRSLAVRP
jgi:hypothetical protein